MSLEKIGGRRTARRSSTFEQRPFCECCISLDENRFAYFARDTFHTIFITSFARLSFDFDVFRVLRVRLLFLFYLFLCFYRIYSCFEDYEKKFLTQSYIKREKFVRFRNHNYTKIINYSNDLFINSVYYETSTHNFSLYKIEIRITH